MRRTPPRGRGFSNPNTPSDARDRAIDDAVHAIRADPFLAFFVASLASLTPKRRHEAIWSFDFWWNNLVPGDRAKVVRSYRPSATEAEVGKWSGVSVRSLHRWQEYKTVRQAARRDWPVGYKGGDGQIDAWRHDG
jgi:hypothetical protein